MKKITIGYGLLFPENNFNFIRRLEIDLAHKTDNFLSLTQCPHITIKRPFTINYSKLQEHLQFVKLFSNSNKSLSIKLGQVSSFETHTLYIGIEQTSQIELFHRKLLEELEEKLNISSNEFDGQGVVFHATLAMRLNKNQYSLAKTELKKNKLAHKLITLSELGLFLYLEQHDSWIVIAKHSLLK